MKPIWAEGVLLAQQHFQCWDGFFEKRWADLAQCLGVESWGFQKLQIDDVALDVQRFSILQCHLRYKGGALIDFNSERDGPLTFDLQKYDAKEISLYLCLPDNHSIKGIAGYENKPYKAAWQAYYKKVRDVYDGERERELLFAKPNLSLHCESDIPENHQVIKIAKLFREGAGVWFVDRKYIPPITHLSVAPHLIERLKHMLTLIKKNLNGRLHNILVLENYCHEMRVHPRSIYVELLRLVGLLEVDLRMPLPEYHHDDIGATLSLLIERMLQAIIKKPAAIVERDFRKTNESLWTVVELDSGLFADSLFHLRLSLSDSDKELVDQFIRQIKVGAIYDIDLIVTSALPGLSVLKDKEDLLI